MLYVSGRTDRLKPCYTETRYQPVDKRDEQQVRSPRRSAPAAGRSASGASASGRRGSWACTTNAGREGRAPSETTRSRRCRGRRSRASRPAEARTGAAAPWRTRDIATGRILARCKAQHRHREFPSFLRHIDANVPPDLDIHLVVDNYGTHRHAGVKRRLADRPRCHIYFTPTGRCRGGVREAEKRPLPGRYQRSPILRNFLEFP